MTSAIRRASKSEVYELIGFYGREKFGAEQFAFFRKCVNMAAGMWTGYIDGDLVCIWGLIPPSLLSEQAYLWLYTTEELKGHEFLFIRRSQLAVEAMLEQWPTIVGHAVVDNTRAIKWLKWLGATFGEPQGKLIPFIIRRKANG